MAVVIFSDATLVDIAAYSPKLLLKQYKSTLYWIFVAIYLFDLPFYLTLKSNLQQMPGPVVLRPQMLPLPHNTSLYPSSTA